MIIKYYENGRRVAWEYFTHTHTKIYLSFVEKRGNFIIAGGRRCNDVSSMRAFCDQQKGGPR